MLNIPHIVNSIQQAEITVFILYMMLSLVSMHHAYLQYKYIYVPHGTIRMRYAIYEKGVLAISELGISVLITVDTLIRAKTLLPLFISSPQPPPPYATPQQPSNITVASITASLVEIATLVAIVFLVIALLYLIIYKLTKVKLLGNIIRYAYHDAFQSFLLFSPFIIATTIFVAVGFAFNNGSVSLDALIEETVAGIFSLSMLIYAIRSKKLYFHRKIMNYVVEDIYSIKSMLQEWRKTK